MQANVVVRKGSVSHALTCILHSTVTAEHFFYHVQPTSSFVTQLCEQFLVELVLYIYPSAAPACYFRVHKLFARVGINPAVCAAVVNIFSLQVRKRQGAVRLPQCKGKQTEKKKGGEEENAVAAHLIVLPSLRPLRRWLGSQQQV